MSRKYGHIKLYEKEILELKQQGLTQKEIAKKLGFSKDQIKEFFHRYNRNQTKRQTEKRRNTVTAINSAIK